MTLLLKNPSCLQRYLQQRLFLSLNMKSYIGTYIEKIAQDYFPHLIKNVLMGGVRDF